MRERKVKLHMDAMQAHMERLMKAAKSVGELSSVKLVPLSKPTL